MYQVHKNLRKEDPEDNTAPELIANFASDPNHADANFIKLSVNPDGTSYTVAIPAFGYSRSFETRQKAP
jgi:hypothetical protein